MSEEVIVMDTTTLQNVQFVSRAPKGDPLYDGFRVLAWPELVSVVALAGIDIGPETPNVKAVTITLRHYDEPMVVCVERHNGEVMTRPTCECCFGVYKKEIFKRLCRRMGIMGIMWELRTISMVIRVAEGERVSVTQEYNPVEPVTESD